MYIVERTIEKVIDILNEGWKPSLDDTGVRFSWCFDNSLGNLWKANNYFRIMIKPSMVYKNGDIWEKGKEILTNFRGMDFFKFYFTGEF